MKKVTLKTGFNALDEKTKGIRESELVVIASGPSQGSTSLAFNIAANVVGQESPQVVLLFTLGMQRTSVLARLISANAEIRLQDVRTGFYHREHLPALTAAAAGYARAPLYINDTAGLTVSEMRACARRLNAELGAKGNRLGLLIIDSFETIPPGSAKRRLSAATLGEVETAEIVRMQKEGALKRPPWWKTGEKVMRDLKRLAKALGIPVIITAKAEIESCSADVTEVFTDKAVVKIESDPTMTGFIDSFILEHADIVVLIYNEAYYHPENKEDGNAGIVVAKNPRGKTGAVEMKFEREYTKFSSRD